LSIDIDFRFILDLQIEAHSPYKAFIYEMFVKQG
jgi:hypothetical protein